MRAIDTHIHIQPWEMMKPWALETIKKGRGDYDLIKSCMESPAALVKHLDEIRIEKVGLINYVAPDIMGFTDDVNDWVCRYRDAAPDRLIAYGGIHPPAVDDVKAEMERLLVDLGIDALKIHAPHQDLAPNAYRDRCPELAHVYEAMQAAGKPVMFHTGTSVFPGARSLLGDPMLIDDVAVDYPDLKIVLAHGGRPLWMDGAFFLMRRHANVFMDISGVPPKKVLEYFPRLAEISGKVLFGTDWPSPGVPNIRKNLDEFLSLPLDDDVKKDVTHRAADRLYGANE